MTTYECGHRPRSVSPVLAPVVTFAVLLLAKLLHDVAIEAVVPAEGDQTGQTALARPAGHGVW